jgi:hypothetical protein
VETAAAVFHDVYQNVDIASTTALAASYQLDEHWAPMLRLGFVGNNAPGAARDGTTFGNPLLGVTYTRTIERRRLALFGATTLPLGTGGGNDADPSVAKTNAAAMTVRPADDVMFHVNYATAMAGGDVSYVTHGFTAQAEATLQQSIRIRGSESADGTDTARTRAVLGAHVGTYLGSHVSLGGDVLYQRCLTHPTKLGAMTGARMPVADADMDALTLSVGVRAHFRIGAASVHPGLSFTRGLDATGPSAGTMITNHATAFALDVPVLF